MNAKLVAEAEDLRDAVDRLERIGLVLDRAALSPAHRRAALVLRVLETAPPQTEPPRPLIGFAYPNAR